MKILIYTIVPILILSLSAVSTLGSVDTVEIKLISPIGALTRSVIPGWGQFYTHNKLQGIVVFLSVGALGGLGVRADAEYRDYYKQYRDIAYSNSSQSSDHDRQKEYYYYGKSNDYYKVSRFFLYAAAGIWVYSAIDSYIDAHVYNARKQSSAINIDSQRLQTIK